MYCPWDILMHVVKLQNNPRVRPLAYWGNTSSNSIVRTLISQAHIETRKKIEDLINGKDIAVNLSEDLTHDELYQNKNDQNKNDQNKNESNIWKLMYLTGYLTKAQTTTGDGLTALVIPNKEIRTIFIDVVSDWFNDTLSKSDIQQFTNAAWDNDTKTMSHVITNVLYETISYQDIKDSFYHDILSELLRDSIIVNTDNPGLVPDKTCIVIEDGFHNRAIIFELNRADNFEDLDNKAAEALKQIKDKKYLSELAPHILSVLLYGIAFQDKNCSIRSEKIRLSDKSDPA